MIPSFLVSKWSGSFPFHPSLLHPLLHILKSRRQWGRVGEKLKRRPERRTRLAREITFSRRKWVRSIVQVEGLVLGRSKVQFIHCCQMESRIFRHGCSCMGTCRNESFWQFSNCLFPQQVKQRAVEKSLRVLGEKEKVLNSFWIAIREALWTRKM